MEYHKKVECNCCTDLKRLDEIINFDTNNVKCRECEIQSLNDKYKDYIFNINENDVEVVTDTRPTKGVKKAIAWCIG